MSTTAIGQAPVEVKAPASSGQVVPAIAAKDTIVAADKVAVTAANTATATTLATPVAAPSPTATVNVDLSPEAKLVDLIQGLITKLVGEQSATQVKPVLTQVISGLKAFVETLINSKTAVTNPVTANTVTTSVPSPASVTTNVNATTGEVAKAQSETKSAGGFLGLLGNLFSGGAKKEEPEVAKAAA